MHLIAWYFLARGRLISVEVSGHCRHRKQLCGGMEISMPSEVHLLKKGNVKLVKRKDLLTKKVQSLCKLKQKQLF